MSGLQRVRPEGVALAEVAAFHPAFEPAHTLRSAAVGKGFRHDAPLSALLQAVIANLGGGIECLLDFARFDDGFGGIGAVSPDAVARLLRCCAWCT